MTSVKR